MKKAFSLIEVIISIVIISISMMSVPMILKQTSKSNEFSIIQEAILASSTKINNILSYSWDKNSYDVTNGVLRTLDVSSGDDELKRVIGINDSNLRIGHVFQNGRRRFFDYNSSHGITYPNNTINLTMKASINDFFNEIVNIGGSGAYDYKDANLAMRSKIYYVSDQANYSLDNLNFTFSTSTSNPITNNPITKSTNIKMIVLTTTSPLLGHSLTLRAFESNIGQSKLITRTK